MASVWLMWLPWLLWLQLLRGSRVSVSPVSPACACECVPSELLLVGPRLASDRSRVCIAAGLTTGLTAAGGDRGTDSGTLRPALLSKSKTVRLPRWLDSRDLYCPLSEELTHGIPLQNPTALPLTNFV